MLHLEEFDLDDVCRSLHLLGFQMQSSELQTGPITLAKLAKTYQKFAASYWTSSYDCAVDIEPSYKLIITHADRMPVVSQPISIRCSM